METHPEKKIMEGQVLVTTIWEQKTKKERDEEAENKEETFLIIVIGFLWSCYLVCLALKMCYKIL